MEKYLVPPESSPEDSTPMVRRPWKRSLIELNGRIDPGYRHELYSMIADSYSEIGRFQHRYLLNNVPCISHISEIENWYSPVRRGVAGIEFDNQGIYIVSVTRAGCLTVHDFEALYCHSKAGSDIPEDESKHVVHLSFPRDRELDVARWNPANQNEVVCTSVKHDKVLIFDISYSSSEATEELQIRQNPSISGRKFSKGLSDVAFSNNGESRVLASDTLGKIHMWDRRVGVLPCMELSLSRYDSIKSIQIYVDNQTIFGAGAEGIIHIWDLRGGRNSSNSSVFQNPKDMTNLPLASKHLAPMLRRIPALKAQSKIVAQQIHSIDVNPSSPRQLAFHLDGGWSGVLDMYNSQVTHVHCPPPFSLDGSNNATDLILRKPSWLPTSSNYLVGSMVEKGIHILDFHPSSKSPCHVDYDEDSQMKEKCKLRNKFVPLSEYVTGCAAHPLNRMIVAGTWKSCMLLFGPKTTELDQRNCTSE